MSANRKRSRPPRRSRCSTPPGTCAVCQRCRGRIDPWEHYLAYGAAEGRNPHPLFDTAYYLKQCPEVATGRLNPLIHFFQAGAAQGAALPAVRRRLLSAAISRRGRHESAGPLPGARRPRSAPAVRQRFYLRSYPDVAASGINPLVHFLQHGVWERTRGFQHSENPRRSGSQATGGRMATLPRRCPTFAFPVEMAPRQRRWPCWPTAKAISSSRRSANLLVAGLCRCGLDASAGDERTDPRSLAGFPLVVAPHEFFCVGTGRGWARPRCCGSAS